MSLRVWLPLNGNLNNQGSSNSTISSVGPTVNDNGKIGKCYSFGGYLLGTQNFLSNSTPNWSYCCWVKFNSLSSWNCLFSDRTAVGTGGMAIFFSDTCAFDDGSRWQFTPKTTIATNTWFHLCFVRDSSKGKFLYINGVLDSSTTELGTPSIVSDTNFAIGASQQSSTSVSGNQLNGYLNDVRIYDHAISPKEIKEISKGLVLHWTCNNKGLGNVNPNLIKNTANGSGWSCSTFDKIEKTFTRSTTATTESFIQYRADLTAGTTYTFSGEVKTNGQVSNVALFAYDSTVKNVASKGVGAPTEWTKVFLTFTPSTSYNWTNCYIRFDNDGSKTSGTEAILYARNIKVEEGSIVTSWCPHIADPEYTYMGYNNNTEYDTSGYKHHGTVTTMPTVDSDTPKYTTSYKYTGVVANTHINTTTDLNFTDNFSWSSWFKPNYTGTTAQYAFTVGRADAGGYGYGFQILSSTQTRVWFGSSQWAWTTAVANNEWRHITFTKNGTAINVYENGVVKVSATFGGTLPTYSDGAGIGIGAFHYSGGNIYPYYGNISDFRIYATALSADDIKELYQSSAFVTNNGSIMCYDFIEE